MTRMSKFLVLVAVLLLVVGCKSRTDKADSGGVILSVTDYDGFPQLVSVSGAAAAGFVVVETVDVDVIATNPNVDNSELQTVEMESYEVTYTRNDAGQRVPVALARSIGGAAEEGGKFQYGNLVILTLDQLDNPPLSDLQPVNGGYDRETGNEFIVMNLSIRFFGRTIAGHRVASNAFGFTVNFER
jgi:hypothetical protein